MLGWDEAVPRPVRLVRFIAISTLSNMRAQSSYVKIGAAIKLNDPSQLILDSVAIFFYKSSDDPLSRRSHPAGALSVRGTLVSLEHSKFDPAEDRRGLKACSDPSPEPPPVGRQARPIGVE
jgi:hypothetical protein